MALALCAAGPAAAADVRIGSQGVLYVDGEPTFVIGLSGGPPLGGLTPAGTDGWAEVASSGVRMYRYVPPGPWTLEMVPQAEAWLDAAHAYRGFVWMGLRDLARAQPGDEQDAMLRQVVPALKDHPGMGVWRGIDEPWWSFVRPAEVLAHAYATVKKLDPATPLLTIQAARGTHAELAPYSAFTDIHGADPYPVSFRRPNLDLHDVGRWTKLMQRMTPSRAVLMTLAICHGGSWNAERTLYRLPTLRETRYKVYDAIMNGARGLNFYGGHLACMSESDKALGFNWGYWYGALRPVLLEIAPGSPLHAALVRPQTGVGLRIGYGGTVISRRTDTDLWIVAARHVAGDRKRSLRISGIPSQYRRGKIYGKPRTIEARGGSITVRLNQWGVQVLRFPHSS